MAVLHLHGHGVERDAIEAYAWLLQSSANGNENSKSLMHELDGLLNAKQIDEARIRSAGLPVAKPKADFAQED
jgi:TPR repeat protein